MSTRTGRFSSDNRINRPGDYKQAFKTRIRSRDSFFLVLANKNNKSVARLGLAISKKAIGSAVSRNTVKRLAREQFRRNSGAFTGWDIVVVTNRTLNTCNKKQLRSSLSKHWQRLTQCV